MTPGNYTIPDGWILVTTQDFEGTVSESMNGSVTSTRNHSVGGSKSLEGAYEGDGANVGWYWSESFGLTGTEYYASWYDYWDSSAKLNDEIYIARFYSETPVFQEVIADVFGSSSGENGGFNSTTAVVVIEPQGTDSQGGITTTYYGPLTAFLFGQWVQWEVHFKPNTVTAGSANSDGFMRIYRNGTLFHSKENAVMNGTLDLITNPIGIQLGGTYTKLTWVTVPYLDPYSLPGDCASTLSGADHGPRVSNFYGTCPCTNQCPPSGYVPIFNRFIDDVIIMSTGGTSGPPTSGPYQVSPTYPGVSWDTSSQVLDGYGSDLWPTTWGADGGQYFMGGDGGGMDGQNLVCRSQLNIGYTLETPPTSLNYIDVLGCKADGSGCTSLDGQETSHDPACDAGYASGNWGFPTTILAVENKIYILANTEDSQPNPSTQDFLVSTDSANTFTDVGWNWSNTLGDFGPAAFLQNGQNYGGNSDGYAYIYGFKNTINRWTTQIYLARVPVDLIGSQGSYQWFTGTTTSPSWGTWANAVPVFTDTNYMGDSLSAVYNPGIGRYLLTTSHSPTFSPWKSYVNHLGMFESQNPYGPWYTIAYESDWLNLGDYWGYQYHIPAKWISSDGLTIWVVYSGGEATNYDAFRLIKGTINSTTPPGSAPILVSHSPETNETIPVSSGTLSFQVSDGTELVDTSVQMKINGGASQTCGNGLSCVWAVPNTVLNASYTNPSNWAYSTTYTINVIAQDVYANTLDDSSWIFYTENQPTTPSGDDVIIHIHRD